MHPKPASNYLNAYPDALTQPIQALIAQGIFANRWLEKYPMAHTVRTDRALYDYVTSYIARHMRNAGQLSSIRYDSKLHVLKNALGMHTTISRVQGVRLKTHREIRIAAVFKQMPIEFLNMIVVHELAHLKERAHNKSFYQLCVNMAPDYHQLEFDLRAYMTYLDAQGQALWLSGK